MPQKAIIAKPSLLEKMGIFSSLIQKNRVLFATYPLFLLTYSFFALVPSPPHATLMRYHLSGLGIRVIYIAIIILLAVIWAIGFYGYAKLRSYVQLISDQKDGKNIELMSRGIFFLVMWLPISQVVSSILNFVAAHNPSLLPAFTIINNYINLALPLTAFIFIGMASRGLSGMVKQKYNYIVSSLITLVVVYIGLIYTHLVASTSNRDLVYHLSIWPLLLTIVAPYVYMWFIGAIAAYELLNYQRKVSGVLYRRSWSYLAFGCGWLIVTSIIFQYLSTLNARLLQLSIYWLLVIIFSLLAILSVGFIFIAIGATRLQKIEEV